MASVEINLTCNLQTPVKVQYIDGNMFSLDNAGNTINVLVFNGEEPAELGGSVAVSVIRSDGATVAVSGAISGNKAYAILPQSCYAVPGVVSVVIKNVQNTTITTLAAFVANVYQTSTETTVDPGTIIPSVSALIAQIEAAVGSIPADYSALLATIAADYSPSKAYPTVGAYAWCNGVLRRSIVPIPTAETYNAAHWTDAVIGDDLSNLKSAINTIGVSSVTYAQSADTAHSSSDDVVCINAKSGQNIIINVLTDVDNALTGTIQVYGYYSDGTNSRIALTSDRIITATLSKDLVSVGLYYSADRAVLSCNVTIVVKVLVATTFYGEFNVFRDNQTADNQLLHTEVDSLRAFKLPLGELIAGSYVETTGVITNYSGWSRTDYLDISALNEIFATSSVTTKYNCFYDSNKTFISSFYVRTTVEKVPVPANAKYVIFSNSNSGMASLEIGYSLKFTNQSDIIKNAFTGVYCDTDIDAKMLEYGSIVSASGEADAFLFFTDPHPFYGVSVGVDGWKNTFEARMPLVEKAYNSTPTSFCLCGGDWLSDQDTPAQAVAKLGFVTGTMKHFFDKWYMVCGNHDTNYQGTERLSNPALINAMYNGIGKMYYTFTNPFSRFYVFDTALDWDHSMGSYRWSQIDWFANGLIENDDAHSVIALHIVTNQTQEAFESDPVFHEFATNIMAVAEAYNNKTSITLNSVLYDFSNTTGTVEFAIAGHSHFDAITALNNIPIMITDWLRDGTSATFDLVLADYTNHVVKTVRIGSGSNRTMNMASAT